MSTEPMTPNTPMTELPVELEPCPFCGGSVVMTELDDEDERRFWVRYVVCDNCDTRMRGWTGWPPKGVPFDRQVMSDEVEVSLSAAWNRRHLSATVPAGDGELVVARLHRREGLGLVIERLDAAWGVGAGLFDLYAVKVANADGSPALAASRLSQGTGVTVERAFKDGVHYATIVDVPNTEEARDEAWRCSKVRALSGDTL